MGEVVYKKGKFVYKNDEEKEYQVGDNNSGDDCSDDDCSSNEDDIDDNFDE